MWLSIGIHILAAAMLVVLSAVALHFILLIPCLMGAVIGLFFYLAFLLLWRFTDQDFDL